MMKYIVCAILLLAFSLASQEIDKKEICLIGCKLLKKDWQRELCEIACNQIKSDSEFEMKKILKKMGKKAYEIAHQMRILSDSESMNAQCVNTASNVRSCAGTGCGVMTTLAYGTPVNVIEDAGWANGYNWKKCVGSFGTGYIASSLLGGCGSTTQCTNTGSNIRSCPSTNCGIAASVSSGTQLNVHGDAGSANGYNWKLVSGSFGTGFIASQLLGGCGGGPTPTPSGGDMSYDQAKTIMPYANSGKLNEYLPYLNSAMREGSINTCLRRSAFIAQLAHESGSLVYMEEIADGSAYEGRRDLGNIYPGDGKRYKGRGPIQLTGRANYRAAGAALGLDLEGNPWQAASKEVGFRIAQWYWSTRSLNTYADYGTQEGFDIITKRVNGGYNGKADRDQFYWRARRTLGC